MFSRAPEFNYVLFDIDSTTVVPEFSLGEIKTKDEIIQRIKSVEFQGGNTNTAEALSYIRKKAFPHGKSDRPKIVILLTDGQSNDVVSTMSEASKAKQEGITLFAIGIGNQVS